MYKNSHQNAGDSIIKETLFFKIFPGSIPKTPLEVLVPSAQIGQTRVRPPPPNFQARTPMVLNMLWSKSVKFFNLEKTLMCLNPKLSRSL